jgi:hypothetical protein
VNHNRKRGGEQYSEKKDRCKEQIAHGFKKYDNIHDISILVCALLQNKIVPAKSGSLI